MARKLRIQYPGAIYHVMNRRDHQEVIFCDDEDRKLFMATLAEGCQKTALQIHSFCLMSNDFHLVIETPNANLVEGMKWLLGVYTSRFNLRHKVFGHLFSGRYKALIVEGSGNDYLKSVRDYVHLTRLERRAPFWMGLLLYSASLVSMVVVHAWITVRRWPVEGWLNTRTVILTPPLLQLAIQVPCIIRLTRPHGLNAGGK